MTVGLEVSNILNQNVSTKFFFETIDRFLKLYRLVATDGLVQPSLRLFRNYPIVRQAKVKYSRGFSKLSLKERLIGHIPDPKKFYPVQFSIKEFAKDIPKVKGDPEEIAIRVGHHLASNTKISEAQNALFDCFESIFSSENYRYIVVEVFTIAEMVSFDLINMLREKDHFLDNRLKTKEKKNRLTMGLLIKSFLPIILTNQKEDYPNLIKNLDRIRKKRDDIVHRRVPASISDVELALNSVQHLLFAISDLGGN